MGESEQMSLQSGILEILEYKRLRASQIARELGTTSGAVAQQLIILKKDGKVHKIPGRGRKDTSMWELNHAEATPSHFEPSGGRQPLYRE